MSNDLRLPSASGAIWDIPPESLPPNVWSDAINVRVRDGKMQSLRGATSAASATPLRFGERIQLSTGLGKVLVYTTKIELELSGVTSDVTCVDTAFIDSATWYLTQYGDNLLLVSPDMHPLFKARTDARFRKLPGWGVNDRAKKILPYANILVAIGITKTAVVKPTLVMWSSVVDPEDAASVVWTPSATNTAGENPLASAAGALIDAEELGGSLMLYFDVGVWRMSFIGGGFIFSFVPAFSDDGALGPHCVVDISDKRTPQHLVLGYNGLYAHNGTTKEYLGEEVQQDFMRTLMDSQRRAMLVHYPSMFEVWLIFTGNGGGFSSGFIFNYRVGTWTRVDNQSFGGVELRWLFCAYATPVAGPTWGSIAGTWLSYTTTLWAFNSSGLIEQLYGLTATAVIVVDDPAAAVSITPPGTLERDNIDLDELDDKRFIAGVLKRLLRILVQARGAGSLTFRVGTRKVLGGPLTLLDDRTFLIGSDHKVDVRPEEGRYLYIRIAAGSGTFMELTMLALALELSHAR